MKIKYQFLTQNLQNQGLHIGDLMCAMRLKFPFYEGTPKTTHSGKNCARYKTTQTQHTLTHYTYMKNDGVIYCG